MAIKDSLNNLSVTVTKGSMNAIIGKMLDTVYTRAANGGRDTLCRFYHSSNGGSLLQVATKGVINSAAQAVKDEAVKALKNLYGKKTLTTSKSREWIDAECNAQDKEANAYGKMQLDGGTVYALDDYGQVVPEALMLAIAVDNEVTVSQPFAVESTSNMEANIHKKSERTAANTFTTHTLVWYDTTAIVNVSSDKNLISTKVQGRDYSRKELVSNGDIKFSVSGQITSLYPDIYPSEEVKKFLKVMRYKGIIEVNNIILDQFGITHIVITDFSLQCKEGHKSVQQYSFNAIGLQPESESIISKDTVTIYQNQPKSDTEEDKKTSAFKQMLQSQLEGLKNASVDLADNSAALLTGMLDGQIDKIL